MRRRAGMQYMLEYHPFIVTGSTGSGELHVSMVETTVTGRAGCGELIERLERLREEASRINDYSGAWDIAPYKGEASADETKSCADDPQA